VSTTVDWLPRNALTEEAVKAVLEEVIGNWSARWFARSPAGIGAVRLRDRSLAGVGADCARVQQGCVTAALPDRGKRYLLEGVLDVDLAQQTLGEGDRVLLDRVATEIMDDLLSLLNQFLAEAGAHAGGGQVNLVLEQNADEVLTIAFPTNAIVALLKARLRRSHGTSLRLTPRLQALAPTRVAAYAVLGTAELGATEVEGLAAGDVIVLDRALAEGIELRLRDSGTIGCGKLENHGDRVSIALQ
jgi:hypothetical protein